MLEDYDVRLVWVNLASCKRLYLKSTGYIKKTERQHTFHIGIASGSTRYCWKWRLVKFISCPKTMIELYQIYFSIATLGPAKTSYARPRSRKKKKINLCHVVFCTNCSIMAAFKLRFYLSYLLTCKLNLFKFFEFILQMGHYSTNKIRKTQNEHLSIFCQNLNCLL